MLIEKDELTIYVCSETEIKEEKPLNEDLKHYYIHIIKNIKVFDIMKLIPFLDQNYHQSSSEEQLLSILRKIIIFLNEINTRYNLIPKNVNLIEEYSNICPVCLDKESEIHISPCDHMLCFTCVKKLVGRKCPMCRKYIKEIKEHPDFRFSAGDDDE